MRRISALVLILLLLPSQAPSQIVTPGGGSGSAGTEFNEDSSHTSTDAGTMILCVRKDTATALAGTDGDYIPCTTDDTGRIYIGTGTTTDADTGAGTENVPMFILGIPADGGSVPVTSSAPLQVAVPQSGNNLCSGRTILSAASQNETNCNDSNAVLYGIRAFNASSTIHCLLVFNKASAPVAGSDTPKQTFDIPPYTTNGQVGGWIMPMTGDGIEYDTGLGFALLSRTTAGLCTDGVTANATTGVQIDIIYKDK